MSMIQDDLKFPLPQWSHPIIPGNATQGNILLTKTDFTMPPDSQELFKWIKMEDVVGVVNLKVEFDNVENPTKAILSKAKGHLDDDGEWHYEWEQVAEWGVVSTENAQKINKINYTNYKVVATNNQIILYGQNILSDEWEQIGDAIDYATKQDVEDLQNELSETKENLQNEITRATQKDTELEETIDEIKYTTIPDIILDIQNLIENQNTIILPIINMLRQATNPYLVLSKGADGVTLVWRNVAGLNDVVANVNATTQTITFKKVINGVTSDIITIDKIDASTIKAIIDTLTPISNNLNEASDVGDILTKITTKDYNWKPLKNMITILKDETDTQITYTFQINDETIQTITINKTAESGQSVDYIGSYRLEEESKLINLDKNYRFFIFIYYNFIYAKPVVVFLQNAYNNFFINYDNDENVAFSFQFDLAYGTNSMQISNATLKQFVYNVLPIQENDYTPNDEEFIAIFGIE